MQKDGEPGGGGANPEAGWVELGFAPEFGAVLPHVRHTTLMRIDFHLQFQSSLFCRIPLQFPRTVPPLRHPQLRRLTVN